LFEGTTWFVTLPDQSGGDVSCWDVAQPAAKSSAALKMITANLSTRLFCSTPKWIQAIQVVKFTFRPKNHRQPLPK
jgi:hypothetical protein